VAGGIRVRRLHLRGVARDYGISFTDGDGRVRPLSIIAGEISTGKTSALEFIDYCLGDGQRPSHAEIERRVRSAMIELDLNGRIVVIERGMQESAPTVTLHHTGIAGMSGPHISEPRLLRPAGDPESLSALLVAESGLQGVKLREAPTQTASGTDPLSFRDLMWLSFLEHRRLDSGNLLHEATYMQAIKLRQVIDVVFGVHDNALSEMGQRLTESQQSYERRVSEIQAIAAFLSERGIQEGEPVQPRQRQLVDRLERIDVALGEVEQKMEAQTVFGTALRQRHAAVALRAVRLATRRRDRETLLTRLMALRGQYADDMRKFVFAEEVSVLFDPLRVRACPACFQTISSALTQIDRACGLCGQQLRPPDEPALDLSREIRSTGDKLKELGRYITEVETELGEIDHELQAASLDQESAQRDLDQAVASSVAPFLAERDVLMREREGLDADLRTIRRDREFQVGLRARREDADTLKRQVDELRQRIQHLREQGTGRDQVLIDLSTGFRQILGDFRFPKLSGAALRADYSPIVRNRPYRRIGSAGAMTLIALAWELGIFEHAVTSGGAHPGFLMIDSPQKNLKPRDGVADPEIEDPNSITDAVYLHLLTWAAGAGKDSQLIVVDNAPPIRAEAAVVVRYTANAAVPPYGLIDDETSS
jgi:hypothetical protein